MAVRAQKSPFTPADNSTVYILPDREVSQSLTIRVGGTVGAGDMVLLAVGHDPAADNADVFLTNGESFTYDDMIIGNCNEVKILSVTGTPPIYYFGK